MPAAVPAEVRTSPSSTNSSRGSTCTDGIALGERGRVHPVGSGRAAVEQSRGREHEGAGAQPDDPRALLVRAAHRVQCVGGRRLGYRAPCGDYDRAGAGKRFQAERRAQLEPAGGTQRSVLAGADQQAVAGNSRVLAVDSEDGERDGTLEDRPTAEEQHRHDLAPAARGQLTDVSTGPYRMESWLIGTKPPSIVVFLSVHAHPPLSPAAQAKIESTASGEVGGASSAPDVMSTRQLGVKHSITKRFTQRLCWEVRMPSLPRHRRVHTRASLLSSLVTGGLGEGGDKGWDSASSWPKSSGGQMCDPVIVGARAGAAERCAGSSCAWSDPDARHTGRRVVPRDRPCTVVRRAGPRCATATTGSDGVLLGAHPTPYARPPPVRERLLGRRPYLSASGPAQQRMAGRGDRGEPRRGREGPGRGGAAHQQHHRYECGAERRPAHHVAHLVAHGARGCGGAMRRPVRYVA